LSISVTLVFSFHHCVSHCAVEPTGRKNYNKRLTYLVSYFTQIILIGKTQCSKLLELNAPTKNMNTSRWLETN